MDHSPQYDDPQYLDALHHLVEDERVRALGLCNFDTQHMEKALAHGVEIHSNQVQVRSLLFQLTASQLRICCERRLTKTVLFDRFPAHRENGRSVFEAKHQTLDVRDFGMSTHCPDLDCTFFLLTFVPSAPVWWVPLRQMAREARTGFVRPINHPKSTQGEYSDSRNTGSKPMAVLR